MTRKDYVRFAQLVASYKVDCHDEGTHPWVIADHFARCMANVFADDNPRFDRERFLQACALVGE